ncbi:MAG TPA: NAD-dependent epimerase/dehydratase family protein [Patescibacteria group bacterium]|nr:NAD-dependent epimerase/dehydratase family protein [Patescibacteria group bacterium]
MHHVLVTGINGFVGGHVTRTLDKLGCSVSGITYKGTVSEDISGLLENTFSCDLSDSDQVAKLNLAPYDAIINLAGLAQMGMSFQEPELFMHINVSVISNLCDQLVKQRLSPRVIVISSGAIYESNQPMPLKESSSLVKEGSPYSKSKIAMEKVTEKFRKNGLPQCIVARPFNHVGPGQKQGFIVPDLYQKLLQAVQDGTSIEVGNLTTRRDYTDVRDVARAYSLLALSDISSLGSPIYNVCSGVSRSGEDILHELKKHVPGSDKVEIKTDPKLVRPNDPKELIGDNTLLVRDTNWHPEIPLEQTIADFVTSKQS